MTASLAPRTWSAYGSGRRAWETYLRYMAFPATKEISASLVFGFLVFLFVKLELAYSTSKVYMASVRSWMVLCGVPISNAFSNPRLQAAFKTIKKCCPSKTQSRLPINLWLLREICGFLRSSKDPDDDMYADMYILAFFALLRASEVCGHDTDEHQNFLDWAAISFHDEYVDLYIDGSKGDVFRQGVTVRVFRNNSKTCPYAALMARFKHRSKNATGAAPVFCTKSGKPVSYSLFQQKLKATIKKLGYNPAKYSSHSFRIGAATTLALLGFPAAYIQAMGRWKSLAYQLYTRLDDLALRKASQTMADAPAFRTAATDAKGGIRPGVGMVTTIGASVSVDDIIVSFSSFAACVY